MIKVLSLFSGIGAFERACCRIGLDWELVNYCEIDRWASLSYSMVNQCSESLNLRDVRAVTAETVRDRQVDLITYGFPCQDISIAGNQRGFTNDSGELTRSGLFFEALRIIKELRPRYAIAENVKALTSQKFKNEFATVLSSLEEAGYTNYWRVLNAKDFGIPQNRERVFIVSIRRDVDEGDFQFPDKEPLTLRLCDMLEPKVDEKYYINNERATNLIEQIKSRYIITDSTPFDGTILEPRAKEDGSYGSDERIKGYDPNGLSLCINASDYKGTTNIIQVGNLEPDANFRNTQRGRVYDPNGLSPTLCPGLNGRLNIIQVGNLIPEAKFKNTQRGRVYDPSGLAPTLNTVGGGNLEPKIIEPVITDNMHTYGIRIRKLTPRECWRLMGFLDEEFDRVHGISNSQLYKQAGNSIAVNVLTALLSQLFYKEFI